jgi:hypothetical protein
MKATARTGERRLVTCKRREPPTAREKNLLLLSPILKMLLSSERQLKALTTWKRTNVVKHIVTARVSLPSCTHQRPSR